MERCTSLLGGASLPTPLGGAVKFNSGGGGGNTMGLKFHWKAACPSTHVRDPIGYGDDAKRSSVDQELSLTGSLDDGHRTRFKGHQVCNLIGYIFRKCCIILDGI